MNRKLSTRYYRYTASILTLIGIGVILFGAFDPSFAQVSEIRWSSSQNISNSPGFTSTDPFLLADPSGFVHLFWAEKVVNTTDQADTLMYTRWDGRQWTIPVDIFFAPPQEFTLVIAFPHAVIDENGRIHLIWLGEPSAPNYAIYYSSAPALAALSSHTWEPRATLANDLTGTNYSIHIAYTPPTTLHVLYARVATGDQPREERAVTYMRSTDLGVNWSEPIDIYTIPFLDWGAITRAC